MQWIAVLLTQTCFVAVCCCCCCPAAAAAVAAAARYGRIAASDKEIEEVADAACIHEPITTRFPKVRGVDKSWGKLLVRPWKAFNVLFELLLLLAQCGI
jgi:hypothetical protein